MLAARVEPKNGPKENKKTGNLKPVVFDEYQTGVDSSSMKRLYQKARFVTIMLIQSASVQCSCPLSARSRPTSMA
jgi:hypothetical protein